MNLKKNFLIVTLLLCLPLVGNSQAESQEDKAYVLTYFHETLEKLQQDVNGLSQEQLQFKASDSSWSISQCLEHKNKTEPLLFTMVKTSMEQPTNPERKKEIKLSDQDIINMITDRSAKFKAPKNLIGTGKYNNADKAIMDLKQQRKEIFSFIKNTPIKELRNRVNDSPMGATDTYQSLLYVAGHTARHTLQIEEIKKAENFPSK